MTKIKIKIKKKKISEPKTKIIIVKIKKPDKLIEVVIPEIVHTSIVKQFGKLLSHKTRVRLAKLLVRPVTWIYTEILEEL